MSTAPAPIRSCRGCGCTDSRACDGGCWWIDLPSELGPLCSSCDNQIRLVDAGVVDDVTLRDLADEYGMTHGEIARIAAELALRDTRTVVELYEAGVRQELDDQAAAEMTVHVLQFPTIDPSFRTRVAPREAAPS